MAVGANIFNTLKNGGNSLGKGVGYCITALADPTSFLSKGDTS